MKVRSWMLGAAVMGLVTGTAMGLTAGPDDHRGSATGGQTLSTQQLFQNLTGDFEGTALKLGTDGKLIESSASASNRVEENGKRLVSAFESKMTGEPLDGAVVWTAPQNGKMRSTWSYEGAPFTSTGTVASREMKFSGQSTTGSGPKIEQTVAVMNLNSYQVTWHRVEPNGTKTLVMHLDMRRVDDGRTSAASSKASSSRAVAMAKQALEDVQKTAGVNE